MTAGGAGEQEAPAAPDAPDEGPVVATPTAGATANVEALASGALPAALFISLTAAVAAGATTQQEEASGEEQAGALGQASSSGRATVATPCSAAGEVTVDPAAMPQPDVTKAATRAQASGAAVPSAPASDEAEAGAAAGAGSEDLEAALSAAASHEQRSEGAATQAAEPPAAPSATPHADHPARRIAHEILAQVVSPASRESGGSDRASRQTSAHAAPTVGAPAGAVPETALSAERARPGRLAIGARVRADAGSDQAIAAVAPFLDSAGDAGQDQRGGTSRGGHAWPFTWATATEMPRTAVKTSGQPAGGAFSMMAAPAESAPILGAGATAALTAGEGAATTASTPLADADVARQVVRAVSLAWHDQVGEARLHLTPEHLGDVTVSLRVERGVVSAVLQADTAAARDWIRLHENDLRQGLESQGLHLDSMVVTEDGTSQGRQDQQAPPRQPRRAPISPDAPRFEVRV